MELTLDHPMTAGEVRKITDPPNVVKPEKPSIAEEAPAIVAPSVPEETSKKLIDVQNEQTLENSNEHGESNEKTNHDKVLSQEDKYAFLKEVSKEEDEDFVQRIAIYEEHGGVTFQELFETLYQKVVVGKITIEDLKFDKGMLQMSLFVCGILEAIISKFNVNRNKANPGLVQESIVWLNNDLAIKISVIEAVIAAVGSDFSLIKNLAKPLKNYEEEQIEKRQEKIEQLEAAMKQPEICAIVDQFNATFSEEQRNKQFANLVMGTEIERQAIKMILTRDRLTRSQERSAGMVMRMQNLDNPQTFRPLHKEKGILQRFFNRPPITKSA